MQITPFPKLNEFILLQFHISITRVGKMKEYHSLAEAKDVPRVRNIVRQVSVGGFVVVEIGDSNVSSFRGTTTDVKQSIRGGGKVRVGKDRKRA